MGFLHDAFIKEPNIICQRSPVLLESIANGKVEFPRAFAVHGLKQQAPGGHGHHHIVHLVPVKTGRRAGWEPPLGSTRFQRAAPPEERRDDDGQPNEAGEDDREAGLAAVAARGDEVYVNLYASGEANVELGDGSRVRFRQQTGYPWEGDIEIVNSFGPKSFFIDKSSKVSGIEFKTCTAVFDDNGRFNPQYDDNGNRLWHVAN